MNLTLHLTENCNMDCSYCIREKKTKDMTSDVLLKACDLAFSSGSAAGFCFFGGEPLLKKDLIYQALDHSEKKSSETGKPFKCKMTTNGTLLDDEFLQRAQKAGMGIGLSFDGKGQDISRRFPDGSSSAELIEKKAKLLLSYLPDSVAMLTLDPKACSLLSESVKYLVSLGFKTVSCVMAYGRRVDWTEEDIEVLRTELNKTADFYKNEFLAGRRYNISPLTNKIRECVSGRNPADHCHLGTRQMSVTAEGNIYPCTQFLNDEEYYLGNVFDGLDNECVIKVAKKNNTPATCLDCDLRTRCTNSCGCANRLNTGNENEVSPLQCTTERLYIEIADRLGEELYKCDQKGFIDFFAKK